MINLSRKLPLEAGNPIVGTLAELALFSVLFTDGMRVGWAELRSAWRLPGRALLLGLPLTLVITAAFAHWVAGLPWIESLLIGAVLAPTDPVFAAALVGNDKVPARLRQLLNVESGDNDGLALPFVLIFLATASGSPDLQLGTLAGELVVGLVFGMLGRLLQLPQALLDVSPYTHMPALPTGDMRWESVLVELAVAVALVAVGIAGFRRRDVV